MAQYGPRIGRNRGTDPQEALSKDIYRGTDSREALPKDICPQSITVTLGQGAYV